MYTQIQTIGKQIISRKTKSAMVTYGWERRNKSAKDDEIPLILIRDK